MIVKILDSDNEEENAEIVKNRKLIRNNSRIGVNYGNNNPKIKKKLKGLMWVYDEIEEEQPSPTKSMSPEKPGFKNRTLQKRRI